MGKSFENLAIGMAVILLGSALAYFVYTIAMKNRATADSVALNNQAQQYAIQMQELATFQQTSMTGAGTVSALEHTIPVGQGANTGA